MTLLNELGKSDKMLGMQSKLLLFRNEFNNFIETGALMLDSIYHMTLKWIKNHIFGVKNVKILSSFTKRFNKRHDVSGKSVNH